MEPGVQYRIYKSPPLGPVLRQLNLFPTFTLYFPKIRLNIVSITA
jgi:hypothetical protein